MVVDFLKRHLKANARGHEEFWRKLEQAHPRAADEQLRGWIRAFSPKAGAPFSCLPFSAEAMELADEPNHKGLALIRQYKTALRIKLAQLCCDAFYRDAEILATNC